MGKTLRKILVTLFAVFMICLIASTVTTTVTAAGNWGTLKAGDEMQWQSTSFGTVKMKVVNIEGKTLTLEFTKAGNTETLNIDAEASLASASMQKIITWLVPQGRSEFSFQTKNYEFEGTTYKADYSKTEYADGSYSEWFYDSNTGILFELRRTNANGDATAKEQLVSCTADLAEATGGGGGCLGTLLIALFSVTAVVSYSLGHHRKRKHN